MKSSISLEEVDFAYDRAWPSKLSIFLSVFNGFFTFRIVVFRIIDLSQRILLDESSQYIWELVIIFTLDVPYDTVEISEENIVSFLWGYVEWVVGWVKDR